METAGGRESLSLSHVKTSVLIIARNEEEYIEECLIAVLNQSQKPNEVVLVVHNSTDNTLKIAEKYPVTVIPYNGPAGIVASRLEGLRHVSGDIIICTDGDSYPDNNWVEVMMKTLEKGNVLVGSYVKFKGNLFGEIFNVFHKYFCVSTGMRAAECIWGPSFAFWGKDQELIAEILEKTPTLTVKAGLSRNPDDYWLALFMTKRGQLEVTNKTKVTQHTKEQSLWKGVRRNFENTSNARRMKKFFLTM